MSHWRLLPDQVAALSDAQLEAMEYGFLLNERRNLENLSDIIGTLTGTSWSTDSLIGSINKDLVTDKPPFTWTLRPPRKRVSSPLSLVFGGGKLLEELKKQARSLEGNERDNPAIINQPHGITKAGEKIEIVELGKASKEEFLSFVRSHNLGE